MISLIMGQILVEQIFLRTCNIVSEILLILVIHKDEGCTQYSVILIQHEVTPPEKRLSPCVSCVCAGEHHAHLVLSYFLSSSTLFVL